MNHWSFCLRQLPGHIEPFFVNKIEEEDICNIWFQKDDATCHTAEVTFIVLRPDFEDRIISRRADVVWPPRSCDLTPLGYYLWSTVKDKCYADKPETIDALNYFPLLTGRIVLSNKKRNLRKYSVVFF